MAQDARTYYLRYIYRKSDKVAELKRKKKLRAIEYKGGKCVKCAGIFPASVYDFHHVDPSIKLGTGSTFLNWSWERMKPELDKCILLCSNCHRIEHYQEDLNKEKTMNKMAPNTTPATVEVHTDLADLPDFIKQAIKDGKPVEIQTEEEVGDKESTLH